MDYLLRSCAWGALALLSGVLSAQEYNFRSFGNSDGLANLAIRTVHQDDVGFLWVSTENGIFRYDGERFEAFSLPGAQSSNAAAAFGDAPDGSLLVGGDFGLYVLKGNSFMALQTPFKTVNWSQEIQSDGKGHTFLGTERGLAVLTLSGPGKYSFSVLPQVAGTSGPEVHGVLASSDTLWYGCGTELCRRADGTTVVYGKQSGLPASPVATIRIGADGALWVRVAYHGIYMRSAGEKLFHKIELPVAGAVSPPIVDSNGNIIIPTTSGLLIRAGQKWKIIDASKGLRGAVYAVLEDREHSLWIGLAGRGLAQWRGYGQWEGYSTASGLPNDIVYDIVPRDDRTVWVGTEGGLVRGTHAESGLKWELLPELKGVPVHAVRFAPSDPKTVWLGTETRGLGQFNPGTGKLHWYGSVEGMPDTDVYALYFDHSGNLWAATGIGLYSAPPPYRVFHRVREIPKAPVWTIVETADGLWVGGAQGLSVLSQGRWRTFTRTDGLSNQEILSLGAGPDGAVWIGYRLGGGIDRARLSAHGLSLSKGVQRRGSDGLIYFLKPDNKGRLWVGTEQGVDAGDGVHWNHYDTGNGLIWNDCNLNAFAVDKAGTIWIGTSGGLSIFTPSQHTTSTAPVQVVFTRLASGSTDVTRFTNTRFSMRDSSLDVRFTALNTAAGNRVLFRYRLTNADTNWIETTQREIQVALLAPGKYQLEIQAQNEDGIWGTNSAVFSFTVLTPWYRSWWFLSLCVLIPAAAAWSIVRLRIARLKRERQEFERLRTAHDEIRTLAFYDPLTALPNRRFLLERLEKLLLEAEKHTHRYALLLADIDNFKGLNDSIGHQTGDLLLQEIARRFSTILPQADTIARCDGDGFAIILDELDEDMEKAAANAESLAKRLMALVAQPFVLEGHTCVATLSTGITIFGAESAEKGDVLQQAELAMYQAKSAGKDTIRFFAPALQEAANTRTKLEADLRCAIASGQITLFYQPQIRQGRVIGAEALARWQHPERGLLTPDKFISLAEETGLIFSLGDLVLDLACHQITLWRQRPETASLTLSVNISAQQFRKQDFVDKVWGALNRSGADPTKLHLELTESLLVDDIGETTKKMNTLRTAGLRISLDDFGTGYSSLSYLKYLPLGELKIDRSFVRDMQSDHRGRTIVKTIIDLSLGMDLSVIAEGVETVEQQELLEDLGCDTYQGFLFGRPVPIEQFEALPSLEVKAA